MKIKLAPYKNGLDSVKKLRESFNRFGYQDVKELKTANSAYKYNMKDVIVGWGNNNLIGDTTYGLLRDPNLKNYLGKLNFYEMYSEYVPEFTKNSDEAWDWLIAGETLFARLNLYGYGGKGILELNAKILTEQFQIETKEEFKLFAQQKDIKVFTKYFPKKAEYRIMFYDSIPLFCSRKVLRVDDKRPQEINWHIRNLENGFVFQEESFENLPQAVKDVYQQLVFRGLPIFGALDIIYNEKKDIAKVLECNFAPGLIERTADAIVNVIDKIIKGEYLIYKKESLNKFSLHERLEIKWPGIRQVMGMAGEDMDDIDDEDDDIDMDDIDDEDDDIDF